MRQCPYLQQGHASRHPLLAGIVVWALMLASSAGVHAQTASTTAPQATSQVLSDEAAAALLSAETKEATAAGKSDAADPVSRFLSDNGLLDTKPVVALAQQVKDKASDMAADLVISAMDFLGVRYKLGGQSKESGFDCSGFTRHVFERSLGLVLPRRASEQADMPDMLQVNQTELKPGDLVFFNTLRRTFSHVGIYIGDNKFIHSPRAGGAIRIEDMRMAYWQQRFDGARRAPKLANRTAQSNGPADDKN